METGTPIELLNILKILIYLYICYFLQFMLHFERVMPFEVLKKSTENDWRRIAYLLDIEMTISDSSTDGVIIAVAILAIIWAFIQFSIIAQTEVKSVDGSDPETNNISSGLLDKKSPALGSSEESGASREKQTALLIEIYEAITMGAKAFLYAEYKICAIFCIVFGAVVLGLVAYGQNVADGALTAVAFALGAITSILSGYIGMRVAVFSNVRTTINAQKEGFMECFNTAFRAGAVMGFALNGLGLLVLYVTLLLFRLKYDQDNWTTLMECISGYGLGGSTIAMFGRVGGGIYTKAADVGADLVGKVIHGIPEDDPRNPATIADNVGDNVGDVAGMGADLFGSFAEATCACLVIGAQTQDITNAGWGALCFPLIVSAIGACVCFLCSFVATHLYPVTTEHRVELALRLQLILTTVFMIPAMLLAIQWLPENFDINGVAKELSATRIDGEFCA